LWPLISPTNAASLVKYIFGGMGVIARAVTQSVDKVAKQMKTALVGDELIGLTLELSGRCRVTA